MECRAIQSDNITRQEPIEYLLKALSSRRALYTESRGQLMAGEVSGASVPDGIEVDDAAAYFGVTESSDNLHAMMAMEKPDAFERFFSLLGDIVLKPGEFDFELASQSLNCEGGEIYYLVAGHLGIMSMADNLCNYLGLPNSSGETSTGMSNLSESEVNRLSVLCDPMKLLKLFAIANSTGGGNEVKKYLGQIENLFSSPESSIQALTEVADGLSSNLESTGKMNPIQALASGEAKPSEIVIPKPVVESSKPTTKTVEPKPELKQDSKLPKQENQSVSVPLPGRDVNTEIKPITMEPVKELKPVSGPDVPLPSGAETQAEVRRVEPTIDDREKEKAALDAFANAFSSSPSPSLGQLAQAENSVVQEEPTEDLPTVEDFPDDFVSIAEKFEAADTDGDGTLDVQELAQAMEIPVEQAEEIHQSADLDGDGSVSLGEVIASQESQNKINLPKPVRAAPVRAPIGSRDNQANTQTKPSIHGGMSIPNQTGSQDILSNQQPVQNSNQGQNQQFNQQMVNQNLNQNFQSQNRQFNQQFNQQMNPNQQFNQNNQYGQNQNFNQFNQNMNQGFQPTIMSGVYCRGCGIGVDPQWRFCPICGTRGQ